MKGHGILAPSEQSKPWELLLCTFCILRSLASSRHEDASVWVTRI